MIPTRLNPVAHFLRRCLASVVLATTALGGASLLAATVEVGVQDSVFIPDQVAINVGDTVTWVGFGGQDHTVISDTGLFDSQTVFDAFPDGGRFSYTFNEPGTYAYYCLNHGAPGGQGMAGVVVVSIPSPNQSPNTPVNQLPVNGATAQALTPQLRGSVFSDPNPQDFHAASQWVVRKVSDNSVVFDSGTDTVNKTNRTVTAGSLENGTAYSWQVRYKDSRDGWSAYSTATTFTTLVPVVQQGSGLKASYANSPVFTSPLVVTTNAVIDFDWGKARPNRRITADAFGVKWEGSMLPQFTERYELRVQFLGGVRLWVNNQLLIDDWTVCPFMQTRRTWVDLVGGQLASVRVEYAADPGGAFAKLSWTSPSLPLEVVPSAKLFPPAP